MRGIDLMRMMRFAVAMLAGVVDSVRSFANGAEQADDITLLAFKLVGIP